MEILDWLDHLDSSSPPPKSDFVVWPPRPLTRGHSLRLLEKKQQQNQQDQQDNHKGDEVNQPADQRSGGADKEFALNDRGRETSATTNLSTPIPQFSSSRPSSNMDSASTRGQGTALSLEQPYKSTPYIFVG
ncbi:hypothetical protein EV127DRAFT_408352 [Xylaria flabelliformis]|nr:hypothetical protein EV127DRAFT_408352 [Xylaria flabelliformis]